jgi:hypothetical protein
MSAYPANTLTAAASVVAPGAGAVIASIAAPPEGVYEVTVRVVLTGTAETALVNCRLRENTNTVANILTLTGIATVPTYNQVEVNAGGGNLDVIAIAAATGGAIYNVAIQATRIG